MTTVLPFGSNNINVYKYETFSYRISNPYYPTVPTVTQSTGIPAGTIVADASKVVFSATNFSAASSSNELFVIDSSGYQSSNTVIIGPGRFVDSNSNSLTGQNFIFYKNEPITDISFVSAFAVSSIVSSPSLPVGLTFASNNAYSYYLTGKPTLTTASNSYTIIGRDTTGKIATSKVNIVVNNERMLLDVSGSSIFANMKVDSSISSTTITARCPPYPLSGNNIRYTWDALPNGIVIKNYLGNTVTSPYLAADASSTITITGAPTLSAANSFKNAGISSYTANIIASRFSTPSISNSNPVTFSFGETVLFEDTTIPTLYSSFTLDPSQYYFSARTYFASDASITSMISPDLRTDLSINFVSNQQKAYLKGTTNSTTGSATYTIKAINTNDISRSYTFGLSVINDSVTLTRNVTDVCYNFILSRDLCNAKTGYYPAPISFTATAASQRDVSFSQTGLLDGVTFSNSSANTIVLKGVPDLVTSLRNARFTAFVTSATDISATTDISFSIVDEQFTFPTLTAQQTTFFVNRAITPVEFNVTTLSERPVVLYTTNNLPAGLFISSSGLLSGTPSPATSTTGTFTVTAYTGYASATQSYSYTLIGDEILITTLSTSYPISVTQPFGPIDIVSKTYSAHDVSLALVGDITPYQGSNSISLALAGSELTGNLSGVDYLFPGYNFQIQGTYGANVETVNGKITVSNAPTPRHLGVTNDGNVQALNFQSYRDTGDTYFLGAVDNSQTSRFKLGEFLYYDRELSTVERQQIEGYLAWKWNLYANLPISHPYKNSKPTSFSPSYISNCYIWLDGNDGATITTDNTSNVVSWFSRVSGLAATSNSNYIVPKSDVSSIGTRNAVYFSNTTARLEISNIITQNQGRSIFAVTEFIDSLVPGGSDKNRSIFGNSLKGNVTFSVNGIQTIPATYTTQISPNGIVGSSLISSSSTNPFNSGPLVLSAVHSETGLANNVVCYNGNPETSYPNNGIARSYILNGFDPSITWSNTIVSNVLDITDTSSTMIGIGLSTIYRSTDFSNWTSNTVTSNRYSRVLTDGTSNWVILGYQDTDLLGTTGKVFTSSDNGVTFDVSNTNVKFNGTPVYAGLYSSNRYFVGIAGNHTPYLLFGGSDDPSNATSRLAISPDGYHWRGLGTYAFSNTSYNGICTNGFWVAAAGVNGIKYSYDGIDWSNYKGSTLSNCYALTKNNQYYLAGGSNGLLSTSVLYSTDGETWSNSSNLQFTQVKTLGSTNSFYVAGGVPDTGNSTISYSTDALTWTDASSTIPGTVNGVVKTSGNWIAVGGDSNTPGQTISYSSDGITWYDASQSPFQTIGTGVAYNNSYVVAIGDPGSNNTVAISYPGNPAGIGVSWQTASNSGLVVRYPNSVMWDGSKWFIVGSSTTGNDATVAYSTDGGYTWYKTFSTSYLKPDTFGITIGTPISRGSLWYAESSNLSVWSNTSIPLNITYGLEQSNGTIVAVGSGGSNMYRSTDNGTSWSAISNLVSGTPSEITSIKYNNGVWIATGTSGSGSSRQVIYQYSSNLTNWSNAYSNTSESAQTYGLLFDGNSWMSSLIGTYVDASGSPSVPMYAYHTAQKTNLNSAWTIWSSSNLLDKYMFKVIPNGIPSATLSLPRSSGNLVFSSPTISNYIFYQFIPIDPITFTASGIDEFAYFYAVGLPVGLKLTLAVDGQSATLEGTPMQQQDATTPIYIFIKNGIYIQIYILNYRVEIPRVIRKQTSAGAFTSLVRQYTEVLAAQNAINNIVSPNVEKRLGEFMSPEAPDNLKDDPACKKC